MSAHLITARPDLRRHFYRLLGIMPQDRSLDGFDSEPQESVNYFIQQGLWNAQGWLITNGRAPLWRKRWDLSSATWTTDSYGVDSTDLPSDFFRLDGDRYHPALWDGGSDRPWGQETSYQHGETVRGNFFWVQNDKLWTAREAQRPNTLYASYFYRHPEIDDSTTIDFPQELRPLIAAEAAYLAMMESWMPIDDQETRSRIWNNLQYWREKAESDLRPTKEPPRHDPRQYRLSTTHFGM